MSAQSTMNPFSLAVFGAAVLDVQEADSSVAARNVAPLLGNSNSENAVYSLFGANPYSVSETFRVQGLAAEDSELSKLEMTFNRLSEAWKQQTSGYTSVASMVMHPAYLEIISYGEQMIPYILKDLQQKPSHWFIALKTLNKNHSPVNPEDAGNIKKMTAAWIAWGKANGKLS
jgi:hypothetical protein